MKTIKSLSVNGELWHKLKVYCAKRNKTISEVVEELIEDLLEGEDERK